MVSLLTEDQQAIVRDSCKQLSQDSSNELIYMQEAKDLSVFFFTDIVSQSQAEKEILTIMHNLGYVSGSSCNNYLESNENALQLDYPNETLPSELAKMSYRCEVHCYAPEKVVQIAQLAQSRNILWIHAYRLNLTKGILYPNCQSFFISDNSNLSSVLHHIIVDNNIASAWTTNIDQFDWNDYYNIVVDSYPEDSKHLKFHRTVTECQ